MSAARYVIINPAQSVRDAAPWTIIQGLGAGVQHHDIAEVMRTLRIAQDGVKALWANKDSACCDPGASNYHHRTHLAQSTL
jgi:hypothetical protein